MSSRVANPVPLLSAHRRAMPQSRLLPDMSLLCAHPRGGFVYGTCVCLPALCSGDDLAALTAHRPPSVPLLFFRGERLAGLVLWTGHLGGR